MFAFAPDEPASAIVSALEQATTAELRQQASRLTIQAHGSIVTYSRKVFLPLTRLCRDVCHYCTFATTPKRAGNAFLSADEILAVARAGLAAGCREALFTLGDRPEDRHPAARAALDRIGEESTLSYLKAMAALVLDETGLLPHLNAGVMGPEDYRGLRPVAASMGLMLETASPRLSARGGPHFGSPDKLPALRLASIAAAGEAQVPFTTGILVGIGETRAERIEALVAIRDLHRRHGHIQEVIIQNFRAKPGTRMADAPEPSLDEHLRSIAAARLILGADMSIQAPPNLHRPEDLPLLLGAGVNDWGGVSPVTPDHVNPEAPWPHLELLAAETAATGRVLVERLAIGPAFARDPDHWLDATLAARVRRAVDARGLPIVDTWRAGAGSPPPSIALTGTTLRSRVIDDLIRRAGEGARLSPTEIETLFQADGLEIGRIADAADVLRAEMVGPEVTFVVNRNINYTNICLHRCTFCAFSKGGARDLRGPAYLLDGEEIGARVAGALAAGATEVCMQGGIHPQFDGHTYHRLLEIVRDVSADIHIHAFSPLEITHGARSLEQPLDVYLHWLKSAGLATLPGTAAEILDDEVRRIICPDKVTTAEWLDVMRAAHEVGLRSTATIMFGHVDSYRHWARHLLAIRDLQAETGGFTEFVPLPFVHMEAPMWRKGRSRSGPSFREALLMHAVARIVLHPLIPNIQASWVKMGADGARAALRAGANDLGGTLINESITRAAGGRNGQMMGMDDLAAIAHAARRPLRQRTTLYGVVDPAPEPELVGA